ncbi:MAG: glycosyltransferase family 9 protein [Chloracidobacterium sp.]|nr:glycosyltransferase family 9 protein [Chloracidobacterium sp.]
MNGDEIEWGNVKRVLIVKLRSIGDTVLSTPSLIALKRFVPDAEIDILLEDWVAPLLDGFEGVNVIAVGSAFGERMRTAMQLRRRNYDVAFNLHGGTTATFFTRASGAKHRVGYANYQYSFLFDHLLTSANDFWQTTATHSAEQQLALLGFVGVPVSDRPKSYLVGTESAQRSINDKLSSLIPHPSSLALLHPSTAFFTKQWPVENFARTAEFLADKGLTVVAISSKSESHILGQLSDESKVPIVTFDDLTLPEITALASKAKLFVGNDSGMAHIAAAVQTPTVVIFGSSSRAHWSPWTDAPNEIVYEEFPCQPCPGYECKQFGDPKCILSIKPEKVFTAINRILAHV